MYIGLDVGATKIQGIVFQKGRIIDSVKEKTKQEPKEFLNQISSICQILIGNRKGIEGIGIGFPGIINRKQGKILHLPSLPKIRNMNIKKELEKRFNIPVKIENDGKCMAIAEFLFGKGKGKTDIVTLTLGTGIGGGIIINKKLYIGKGSAGEIGHITIEPNGYKCNCGSIGCFEEYSASRGIIRFAKEKGMTTQDPLEIENMARAGNKKALAVYKKAGYYLGIGISTIIKILDPQIIVLYGGLCHAHDLFLKEAKEEIKKRVYFKTCDVTLSKLKNAPAIGAASLFLI